ncbi:MAG TPA: S-adenosylmethionine decarboxylase [Anaerolineaceae bacterium]|nr:S-adenosylmethionine decarboxylase [Anaerolineaceae bacterium]
MTEQLIRTNIEYSRIPEPQGSGRNDPWGWHLALNLYDCVPDLIQSADVIRTFVVELCELIKMRRFGEPTIVNFGEDPRVSGYSLVQLIETSNICGHFANESSAAYLDIFSCKKFDPEVAAQFCIDTFKAQKASGVFLSRE